MCEEADRDEAIVAAVCDCDDKASDDDTDEEGSTLELPSRDALDYIHKLGLYCAQQKFSEKALKHISTVKDQIAHKAMKSPRQTKIFHNLGKKNAK